jgi:LPS-assembly lipoprotein
MWFCRSLALGLCALVLAGCGFRPLYGGGRDSAAAKEMAGIRIEPIADRIGQQLHNHLLDLLNPRGRGADPQYVLRVRLKGSTEGLAVAKSELATRANYSLVARYQLLGKGGGQTIFKGTEKVVSSYNILTSDFATLIAEKDAKARAVNEIGQDIRTQLAVFFDQRRADRKKGTP